MPTNRKYHKSYLYYPDDKDIFDFLDASKAQLRKIRSFIQRRGLYLSKSATVDTYYKYVSCLPLSWDDLVELVDLVELTEKKENNTFTDFSFKGDFDLVSEAFNKVNEYRSDKNKERYKVTQQNGKVIIEVEYLEIDTSKTPMLQGRPATLTIEVEQVGESIRATHTSNETANRILQSFQGFLEESNLDEEGKTIKIESSTVSLEDILDPELRVKFFTNLTHTIDGFDYHSTTNVRVARIPKDALVGNSDEDEDDDLDQDDDDEKIKNVIIQGISIESTPQYRDLIKSGFYISNISWESIEKSSNDKVAFSAGFAKPDSAVGLEYKILHRQVMDGGVYTAREKVLPMMHPKYKDLIQQSSLDSLAQIRKEIEQRSTEPLESE